MRVYTREYEGKGDTEKCVGPYDILYFTVVCNYIESYSMNNLTCTVMSVSFITIKTDAVVRAFAIDTMSIVVTGVGIVVTFVYI